MPTLEHLSILRKGVEAWNLWREENPDVTPDLSGANLKGFDLDVAIYTHPSVDLDDFPPDEYGRRYSADPFGIDLRDAHLQNADLSDAVLTFAELGNADLTTATLNGTRFEAASLRGACLRGADLTGTQFRSCDLAEVDFADAHMLDTLIADSDLSTTRGSESVHHHGPSLIAIDTLVKSRGLISANFLSAVGLPELLITYLPTLIEGMQPVGAIFDAFLDKFGKREERGPGITVTYAVPHNDHTASVFSFLLWGTLRLWGTVTPRETEG